MSEYHPEWENDKAFVHPFKCAEERFKPSWWDRLLGRAHYMNKLNHRNAYIQHLEYVNNTEVESLREGLLLLQPEKVLEQEGKYLDEIGWLKEHIRELEAGAQSRKAVEQRSFKPEPTLIKPERAQALGRMGYAEPNSGAHSTSGQISSAQDGGSGILMQAAMLHTVLAADSAPTRSEAACHSLREAYATEPAYCSPSRSEPSYSHSDSGSSSSSSSSSDSGGGGGGGD